MTSITEQQTPCLRLVAVNGLLVEDGLKPQPQPALVVCTAAEDLLDHDPNLRLLRLPRKGQRSQNATWLSDRLGKALRPLTSVSTAVFAVPLPAAVLRSSNLGVFAQVAPVGRVVIHGDYNASTGAWCESFNIAPHGKGAAVHLLSMEYVLSFGSTTRSLFRAINTALVSSHIGNLKVPEKMMASPTTYAIRAVTSRGDYADICMVDIKEGGGEISHHQL